jgi:TRAP transporter TAXI family solute receptor
MRIAAAFVLLLLLTGCGRGPQVEQVEAELTKQLADAFEPGTFEIVAVAGRGSSSDSTSPPGEQRRVVYYDAELRLKRNVDFGGWNTPGVASLVTVLGAGPKGIKGAKAGGNQAGDRLFAHGSAIYRRDGDAWRAVVTAGFAAPVAPSLDSPSPPSTSDRLLAALQTAVHAVPSDTSPAVQAIVDRELALAVASIQAQLVRLSQGYPVAAGSEGGQYVRLVQALQATKPMGLTFQALVTEGSVENLNLLRQDKVMLALAQSDIAAEALVGAGPFAARGPFTALRALGSLYPEPLHVVVRADSPFRTVRDLMNKRISVGPAGSGTRATAERLLAAHRMTEGKEYTRDESPFSSALAALAAGNVDAVMQVTGVPSDQIRLTAASTPLRLIPIDEAVLAETTAKNPATLRGIIPKSAYPGLEHDVATLTVSAVLATTSSLSDADARSLVAAIFEGKGDLLAAGSAQGGQISARTARTAAAIPLLPAAEAALSSSRTGQ